MNQKFSLSVDNPCSKKFDSFQTTPYGGFCQSCQKEVIDFTEMSEKEIIAFFKNKTESTCGRFKENQLSTYQEFIPLKRSWYLNMFGAGLMSLSMLSFFSSQTLRAQHIIPSNAIQTSINHHDNQPGITDEYRSTDQKVSGIVLDENDEPLPGVSVILKGSAYGTLTDVDGKFIFPKPLKPGYILIFSTVGMQAYQFTVSDRKTDNQNIRITLKSAHCMLLGEVSVSHVYQSKRSFWQKVKDLFR